MADTKVESEKENRQATQARLYSPPLQDDMKKSLREKYFEESLNKDRLHEYGLIEGQPSLAIGEPYQDPDILSIYSRFIIRFEECKI